MKSLLNTPPHVSGWIQGFAFLAIAIVYVAFAPNYQWHDQETGTAYGADFLQEWVGAKMILSGQATQLYDAETFRAWQYDPNIVGFEWVTDQYFPPVYPPPHYLLFTPLACLPYRWAALVWMIGLLATALVSARLIQQCVEAQVARHPEAATDGAINRSKLLWIALFLFPSLLFSITLGQKSILWLLIASATWRLLQTQRDFAAGALFGLLSIKPTLFFLLPLVMLRNGRWMFVSGASVSVSLLWGTAAILMPLEAWSGFVQGLGNVGSYAENGGYRLDWSCNLMTLAYSLPIDWIAWCKIAMCLPLAIYLLYCVFEDRSHGIESPEKALLIFGTTLLLSPHTYHYDLCILMLPILMMIAMSPKQGIAYFAMLSVGVAMAADVQGYLNIPIIPVILIGMMCELRLRPILTDLPSGLLGKSLRQARAS